MGKQAALVAVLAVLTFAGCEKKSQQVFHITPAETSQANPVTGSPSAVETGKKLYHGSDCAICHGKEGDGKGVIAKDISLNIHNWKDPQMQKQFTDGELFYILKNGKGMMPGYAKDETDEQIWQIVTFIRSLSGTGSASTSGSADTKARGN